MAPVTVRSCLGSSRLAAPAPSRGHRRVPAPRPHLRSHVAGRRTIGPNRARRGASLHGSRAVAADGALISVGGDALSVKEHHRELRARVTSSMPEGSVIYLEAGEEVPRNGMDVFYDFRPDSDFFYLTGCAEPGFGALIDTSAGTYTLLSPRVPTEMQHWVGALPTLEELADEYGADECAYIDDAPSLLKQLDAPVVHSLPNKIGEAADKVLSDARALVNVDILPRKLKESREIKSASEVACLQVANDVSSAAHEAVMRGVRGSSFEYQLQSVFLSTTMGAGLRHMGYPPIIGAGRNAATLHYSRNDSNIMPHDVVLMDAGSEFRCYTADITRTSPSSGRFTAEMADVYDAVLAVQELALQQIGPGASWADITMQCRSLLAQHLLDMNFAKGSVDALLDMEVDKLFMPHGLGHFLGLDVHDVDGSGNPIPKTLQPGHVVTCEPGIYFVESILGPAMLDGKKASVLNADRINEMFAHGGVRIEDNVAIMDNAAQNLTSAPKARAEVERLALGE
mmetsp:Transcript_3905/g.10045  ORF Transcript_3905/g.10045 Transcript_3905/m.10045 type:complete len:512 (+) Transcript_3905:183-1718(+)